MAEQRTAGPKVWGGNYLRGVLMGAADVIPGVSGGTVALIVGIYERLVASIRAGASAPVSLLRGDVAAARERAREVEWGLVLPLGAGIVTAVIVGAEVIPTFIERHPERSRAVFFGLIAASIALPWRRITAPSARLAVLAVAAAAGAFLLTGLPARTVIDPGHVIIFLGAAVAICAMILPGVSGAFLLLAMGLYEPTLRAVSDRDLAYAGLFVLGAVLGLGTFAKLLDLLLRRQHDATMAVLVGLMIGALRALWPWLDVDRTMEAPPVEAETLIVVALAMAGFAAVVLLIRVAGVQEPDTEREADEVPGKKASENH